MKKILLLLILVMTLCFTVSCTEFDTDSLVDLLTKVEEENKEQEKKEPSSEPEHKHTFNEWHPVAGHAVNCEGALMYAVCSECSSTETRVGTAEDHVLTYSVYNKKAHALQCEKCDQYEFQDHVYDDDYDDRCDSCGYYRTVVTPVLPPICEHRDKLHTGMCELCGETVEVVHVDAEHNGRCDQCRKKVKVTHVDENGDYECDVCEMIVEHDCVDANVDFECDICAEPMPISEHDCSDDDARLGGDGLCDICWKYMPKQKCVQCKDINSDNECDICGFDVDCDHADSDRDTACDYCDAYVKPVKPAPNYNWNKTPLVMQLTENTNGDELYSVAKKYLSGESNVIDDVATQVRLRNLQAETVTKVDVSYLYYPNTDSYGWGKSIERIVTNIQSGGGPDIYCLFLYDMVGASIRGCFANLLTTASRPGNYFEFNDENYNATRNDLGYMYEYMQSLSLAPNKKMYVLTSDYFIDMVRSFYCIPVSIRLMEQNGADIVALNSSGKMVYQGGDRNGDEEFTVEDFYELVLNGEWTYDRIAAFAEHVYLPSRTNTGTCQLDDDVVGFAISTGSVASSGLLYSSSVTIIERIDKGNGNYEYKYPSTNPEFVAFSRKAKELFGETAGVCVVHKNTNYEEFGVTQELAIRKRFSENKVLFGDIVILGALEFDAYQNMKQSGGFGVVPVPVYREGDKYLTQIHNIASCGAIAIDTANFSQCTAFLNYQSTNSAKVIETYYNFNVKYGLATESEGTVEMLEYLRKNVRTSFDKAMEDAIGIYMPGAIKWHNELANANYQIDITHRYETYYATKQTQLECLAAEFLTFQD